jgi:hypothetical protein
MRTLSDRDIWRAQGDSEKFISCVQYSYHLKAIKLRRTAVDLGYRELA